MREARRSLSLRSRFLLVVLLGVLLPLGLVGLWVIGSAERSGEALLRARLDQSLHEIVEAAGLSWVERRSGLLHLAESPLAQAALRGERAEISMATLAAAPELRAAWEEVSGEVTAVVLRDARGSVRGRLQAPEQGAVQPGSQITALPVELPVHDRLTGERLGRLEALVPPGTLIPAGLVLTGVGGSLLAAFVPETGAPLLPSAIDAPLLRQSAFQWGGERWVVVHRALSEPALEMALAAPVGPFAAPFEAAARRGTLAFLLAVAGTVLLATLVTRRITGSLERLAEAADAVTRGDLERTVTAEGPDEIRRLARAFNSMTESLRRTLHQLSHREALAAMGELASSIAHEVRNPLTSIRLDLQRAAERAEDPERTRELVGRALREIDRLDASVAGALRLARSGRVRLSRVDVREPLTAAVRTARPHFQQRGATLELTEGGGGGTCVLADAAALEQLLLNLLLNAAEALPEGGRAEARLHASNGTVTVAISDDGPGIAPEHAERVFEAFYSTKAEGTGLGLAIARRIATAVGGELRLESEPGVGTSVSLTLPRERAGVTPTRKTVSNRNDPERGSEPVAGRKPALHRD